MGKNEKCNLRITCNDINIETGATFKVDGQSFTTSTGNVDVLTDHNKLKVVFKTKRKLKEVGTGAVCEVSCIGQSEPTEPSSTASSIESSASSSTDSVLSSTGGSTGDCKC